MSTIAILGGHGQIARQLTRLLHASGDTVLSIIRNPDHADDVRADGATAVIHDIEADDAEALAGRIAGADAVVFAAGGGGDGNAERKKTVDLGGSTQLIAAAQRAGIARFVQISFIDADKPTPPETGEVFAAYWDAKREADEALRASGLDYTIVKPGMLTDEPASQHGEVGTGLGRGSSTRRGDVALFIQLVLREPRSIGHDLDVIEGELPLGEALQRAVS